MIDPQLGGESPFVIFSGSGYPPHGYTGEGTLSPRVISYQMDFTPEANKRMNPKPILSEEL